MDLRIYASTEIRKGGSMSKTPDLSAFPIPRKGGARPIMDDAIEGAGGEGQARRQFLNQPRPSSH